MRSLHAWHLAVRIFSSLARFPKSVAFWKTESIILSSVSHWGLILLSKWRAFLFEKQTFIFLSFFTKIRVLVIIGGFMCLCICEDTWLALIKFLLANKEFELKLLKMFWTRRFLRDLFSSLGPLKFATQPSDFTPSRSGLFPKADRTEI